MMNIFATMNTWAVLVAAVAAFFIGFMWHGPVFGKTWMKLMKITSAEMEKGKKDMEKKMPIYMLAAFVQQLIVAWVSAMLAAAFGVTDVVSALLLAFMLWLGYIATTLFNGVLWEKRSLNLYLFNVAYHLVSLIVIIMIVGLWR